MPVSLLQISYSLSNIESAADQLWQYAHQYRIFAFSGEMGAGKTTFIHTLCNRLGVTDAVSSPTFSLINEYHFSVKGKGDHKIYHMDWYRIRDIEEALNAGIEECLGEKETYSFIEWPEKAVELLPHPHLWITIQQTGPKERLMEVSVNE
jgi:tRNA threonylcarbamoyladenosine biosynthesis protein TsaE